MVLTAEESGATIGAHPGVINKILSTQAVDADLVTNAKRARATKTAIDRYMAVAFLLGADKIRYGTLVAEIENEYLHNKENLTTAGTYLTTVAEAYDYLCNYKNDPRNLSRLLGHNASNLNTEHGRHLCCARCCTPRS
jgi:hypothetical protein